MKIPDFTSVGVSNPSPAGVPSYSSGGGEAIAGAVANVGTAVGKVGDTLYKREANLALATANSETLRGLSELQTQLQDTPDYKSWQTQFDAGAKQVHARVRQNLLGPETQAIYDNSFMQDSTRMSAQMADAAHARHVSTQRAGIKELIDHNNEAALATGDDVVRTGLLQSTNEAITAGVNTGVLNPEEGVAARKGAAEKFAKDYIASLPADAAIAILSKSLPDRYGEPANGVDIHNAIWGQESGKNPKAATSVDGAVGFGQVRPATFARYAKPGERIENADDNKAVSARIIDDYSARPGWGPDRVAVAYFSGEGNVSPPGADTPWLHDAKDGNGKRTSSYVSDVLKRMGFSAGDEGVGYTHSAKTGTPADFLEIGDRRTLLKAAYADAKQQLLIDAQVKTIQDRQTASQFLQGIYEGKVKTSDILKSGLPAFGENSQNELLGVASKVSSGTTNSAVFLDAYERIHLPAGDPHKITSPSQIRALVDRDSLSYEDAQKLIKQDLEMQGTDEGDAIGDLKKGVYDVAKGALVKANPISGLFDPNDSIGQQQLLKFRGYMERQYTAGLKAGKSPEAMLTPGSKDYIGNAIQQFVIPDAQRMNMSLQEGASRQDMSPKRQKGESAEDFLKRNGL